MPALSSSALCCGTLTTSDRRNGAHLLVLLQNVLPSVAVALRSSRLESICCLYLQATTGRLTTEGKTRRPNERAAEKEEGWEQSKAAVVSHGGRNRLVCAQRPMDGRRSTDPPTRGRRRRAATDCCCFRRGLSSGKARRRRRQCWPCQHNTTVVDVGYGKVACILPPIVFVNSSTAVQNGVVIPRR